jgi:hypothetical protein
MKFQEWGKCRISGLSDCKLETAATANKSDEEKSLKVGGWEGKIVRILV